MYSLSYFKENDEERVRQFMRDHPFALLTGVDENNAPVATQVPLLIDEQKDRLLLYGHVQRKTDHQRAFAHNPRVLAVFTGPHSYVSASWYPDPKVASTWNYIAVHARGTLRFLDEAGLRSVLSRTTALFENNPQSPALVEKMSEEYLSRMMKAITAFEIDVQELDNVFKLSQNRDEKTFENIIHQLDGHGDQAAGIAAAMRSRQAALFSKGDQGDSNHI